MRELPAVPSPGRDVCAVEPSLGLSAGLGVFVAGFCWRCGRAYVVFLPHQARGTRATAGGYCSNGCKKAARSKRKPSCVIPGCDEQTVRWPLCKTDWLTLERSCQGKDRRSKDVADRIAVKYNRIGKRGVAGAYWCLVCKSWHVGRGGGDGARVSLLVEAVVQYLGEEELRRLAARWAPVASGPPRRRLERDRRRLERDRRRASK